MLEFKFICLGTWFATRMCARVTREWLKGEKSSTKIEHGEVNGEAFREDWRLRQSRMIKAGRAGVVAIERCEDLAMSECVGGSFVIGTVPRLKKICVFTPKSTKVVEDGKKGLLLGAFSPERFFCTRQSTVIELVSRPI